LADEETILPKKVQELDDRVISASVTDNSGATMNRNRTGVMAVVASALLLAAACSDSKSIAGADTSSTSSSVVATTTSSVVAASSTTIGSETSLAPATTLAPAPTIAPTVAPPPPPPSAGGVVLGQPTNLQAAAVPAVALPPDYTCDGSDPGIPGWHVVDCQYMPSYEAGVVTLVAQRNDDGSYGVFVLFQEEGMLRSLFEAYEPGAGTWSGVTVQVGDFHFDDGAEVWIGYRYAGTGQYLDLDVLDPQPEPADFPASRNFFLGGLQGLDHGSVDLHPGGATVLSAVYGASDPGCCPSSFLVREVTWAADQWRINAGTTYPAASVPPVPSDF
jgi:hypothetical protein